MPSFQGRFCDQATPINYNRAEAHILFGLVGNTETDQDRVSTPEQGTLYDQLELPRVVGEEPRSVQMYTAQRCEISHPDAQLHIVQICDELIATPDMAQPQSVQCLMQGFRDWVQQQSAYVFPVPKNDFTRLLTEWLSTDGGIFFSDVGFHRQYVSSGDRLMAAGQVTDVAWLRISFHTHLSPQAPGFVALPVFNRLENFVWQKNQEAPPALSDAPAIQTSNLWIKMFTEVSAINGVVYAMGIIACCSFITIFIFTGHSRMAGIVVTVVFGMLFTILGCFKIAGWSLGIVEAISALVLVGSSVDYSLHVAEAFVECSQLNRVTCQPYKMGRAALVTQALTRIGVSVLNAAATTFLSVLCLMFCNVALFVKFGQVITVSVIVSIVFALMPLGSVLGLCGPRSFRRSMKRQIYIFIVIATIFAIAVLGLYSLDRGGQIDVTGPAGEPLFGRKADGKNEALDR
eukprot:SAG31_NODE_470_length_15239_cov_19.376288_4_plen_460_part_00